LLTRQLPELGINTHLLLGHELGRLDGLLAGGRVCSWRRLPIRRWRFSTSRRFRAAHRHGALLAVDNTFATPVNHGRWRLARTLSCTARPSIWAAIRSDGGRPDGQPGTAGTGWRLRKNLGQMLAPETAALCRAVCAPWSARRAAECHGAVGGRSHGGHRRGESVLPRLAEFPGHALAQRQMQGFGGMLTIETQGGGRRRAVADR